MASLIDIRLSNFRILRAVEFGTSQKMFGRAIGLSQSEVSLIEMKNKEITPYLARKIEKEFLLPPEWMDRDNAGLLLTANEFDLVTSFKKVPSKIQQLLLNLVKEVTGKK